MTLEAIKWDQESCKLEILDQTLLPATTKYIQVTGVKDGWNVINKMQVRGAPAIAIVGSLSVAVEILQYSGFKSKMVLCDIIVDYLDYLLTARPTAVNMNTAANQLKDLVKALRDDKLCTLEQMKISFVDMVGEMLDKDIEQNKSIGNLGANDILNNVPQGSSQESSVTILTHCNTGSLATAGYGTALGVIRSLYKMGRLEHVYCTETRPYNQGARLTAYELVHEKIPATLICDNMVAALMKTKQITAVVVGADRVAVNGDTANKIGTYQIAILAKYHNIPFYVAAPLTSMDFQIEDGNQIIIEERSEQEITHVNDKRVAAQGIKCWNPAFDVTPASLITGIITEVNVFKPEELIEAKRIMSIREVSRRIVKKSNTDSFPSSLHAILSREVL